MNRTTNFIIAFLFATLFGVVAAQDSDKKVLLFSFFRGNGEDGLFLAYSRDGLKWEELKPRGKSFLEPKVGGKLMRDPCICMGPDGRFHMVWTTSWGQPPVVGYAWSSNLVHWSEQQAIPVMNHEPKTRNVWAPELFYYSRK
ncbi:MAG: glycosyl hydrolase, partial [Limisphaerales bacterium]